MDQKLMDELVANFDAAAEERLRGITCRDGYHYFGNKTTCQCGRYTNINDPEE